MMRIIYTDVWNGMMWHDAMRCCMNEYTYVGGEYEFFASHKARIVVLLRGLC